MSAVCVTVEHKYKKVKQYCTRQDFACNRKVRQSPIGMLYKASCLQLNFRTCLYGGEQVQDQYEIRAPSLDEYLAATNWARAKRGEILRSIALAFGFYFCGASRGIVLRSSRNISLKFINHSCHQIQVCISFLTRRLSTLLFIFQFDDSSSLSSSIASLHAGPPFSPSTSSSSYRSTLLRRHQRAKNLSFSS